MREDLRDEFLKIFSGPLPGRKAQWIMAPQHRLSREQDSLKYGIHRESAVLILLNPFTPHPSFFLIERQGYDGPHSGQISLPGGKKETGDVDFWHTALRETTEELGFPAESILPLGSLTELFIPVSRFMVYPKIGILREPREPIPDQREVKRLLNPALSDLLDDSNREERMIPSGEFQFQAPVFLLGGAVVWGATAMILSEFAELIRPTKILQKAST